MSVRVRTIAAAAALAATGLVVSTGPASAATLTVDVTTDSVDANPGDGTCADAVGDCSLRAAVQEANASAGSDTISLGSETYELTLAGPGEDGSATGDLDVTSEIAVASGGVALIDAFPLGDRIFDVKAGATLTLDGVGLTGGTAADVPTASGGGVLNAGTFVGTDVSFLANSANRAGGGLEASAGSTTTLTVATFLGNTTGATPGNGGALHLTGAGTVTITDSFVSFNEAANEGGGLWNSSVGTMTVTGTEINDNVAAGALATNGGGGIFNQPSMDATTGGTVTVVDSDIRDNAATGAAGSGGGIFNSRGTVTITDTTITGNTAVRAGGGIEALGGTTRVIGGTLVDNDTGAAPGNGGGLHLTGPGTVEVTGTTVAENAAANEGGGLWNSAGGTMTVTGATIRDNTAAGALATNGGGGIFVQPNMDGTGGGTLNVTDTTITGNAAIGAAGSGGGVFNSRGATTITGSTFVDNQAARAGGAIEALAGTTTVTDTDFTTNTTGGAPGNGGAIHLTGAGTVAITGGTAAGNRAANEGGAFWNSATGTMTITDVDITGNQADGDAFNTPDFEGGGGVFNDGSAPEVGPPVGGTLTVTDSRIAGNSATVGAGSGGGILNVFGTLTVEGSVIEDNESARAGGGIEANGGVTVVNGSRLEQNATTGPPGNGGAFHLTGAGTVAISGSDVVANRAANEGGGLWVSATGTMTVEQTRIEANVALGTAEGSGGGGLYNDGGSLAVANTTVVDNEADLGGGVLHVAESSTTLIHVTVTGNDAADGSGIATLGTPMDLANTIVAANTGSADCFNELSSLGGNVLGGCESTNADDQTGVDDPDLDGDLVPLADGTTVDAGLNAVSLPTDLVGTVRPLDGNGDGVAISDPGAFEAPAVDPVPTPTTTTTTPAPSTTVAPAPSVPTTAGPAPTTPAGVAPASGSTGTLPVTGAPTQWLVLAGALLLTAGAVLATRARRRSAAAGR
jgi:LPXTG-motif cell wall-anchored protein